MNKQSNSFCIHRHLTTSFDGLEYKTDRSFRCQRLTETRYVVINRDVKETRLSCPITSNRDVKETRLSCPITSNPVLFAFILLCSVRSVLFCPVLFHSVRTNANIINCNPSCKIKPEDLPRQQWCKNRRNALR